jgi:hypothetical protein
VTGSIVAVLFLAAGSVSPALAQKPNDSLFYYFATPGDPWTAFEIAGSETTFSGPAVFVRSADPAAEADVVAQGPNHSLFYYFAAPGNPWIGTKVAGSGTTFSAPSIFVRPTGEADIVAQH